MMQSLRPVCLDWVPPSFGNVRAVFVRPAHVWMQLTQRLHLLLHLRCCASTQRQALLHAPQPHRLTSSPSTSPCHPPPLPPLLCCPHRAHPGLTSAMYCLNSGGEVRQVPNPDPVSGLYIRDRHGRVVKANIPPDCIAFQVPRREGGRSRGEVVLRAGLGLGWAALSLADARCWANCRWRWVHRTSQSGAVASAEPQAGHAMWCCCKEQHMPRRTHILPVYRAPVAPAPAPVPGAARWARRRACHPLPASHVP